MMKVTFNKAYPPYRIGDVAGLDEAEAEKLVENGVCLKGEVEAKAEEPAEAPAEAPEEVSDETQKEETPAEK